MLGAQFSVLVPDWLRALFFGYPLARKTNFAGLERSHKRGTLSQELLTSPLTPLSGTKPRKIIDAVIPAAFFLKRKIRVPVSARNKLTASAELDLRQRTPFSPGEVYWQLSEPEVQNGFIEVNQWVVKKIEVDAWRKKLGSHGFQVRRIFVDDQQKHAPIADFSNEILPWRRSLVLLNGTLAIAATTAVLFGWLYPAWVAQQQTLTIDAHLKDLRGQAFELRRTVEDMRTDDVERATFLDTVLRRPLLVDTLRELTVALPDSVWVSAMIYTPKRVVLDGETNGSAAQIVLDLGERRSLGNPRLSGPVQRTATNAERFEITVDLGR